MIKFVESELGPLLDTIIDYRGKTPKKLKGEWVSSGIPALSAKNIKHGKIVNLGSIRYVNEELYSRWMKEKVKKGDILMTSEAPLGETFYVKNDDKILLSQRLFAIRTKDSKLDSRFLFYYFNSKFGNHELLSRATGTTVGGIRQTALVKVMVRYPGSVPTQKQIASILSVYDDLVENNEKRIKTLEEMAQLLYTEWFVKFKFAGHEKVKMVESDTSYGLIPNGWVVTKLSDVMSFIRGRSYSSEQINDNEGDYYIVNLKNFNRGGGFRFDGAKYYSGPMKDEQLLKPGDVVVAVTDMTNDRAVIARPARIPNIASTKVTLSADVVKIVSEKLPSAFVYYSLLDYRFTEATKNKASGANVLHLKPTAILEHSIVIPPFQILKEFSSLCTGITGLIDKLSEQNQALAETRNLLIPQLVTGRRELAAIPLSVKEPTPIIKTKKDTFKEAILFSDFVGQSYTSTFFPTHLRMVKYVYFGDRFLGVDPSTKYTESRFGPYNSKSTYAGGEKLALAKKYVQRVQGGFKTGQNIAEINKYTYSERGAVTKVLSLLKAKKDNELELLATVDYIVYSKLKSGEIPTEQSVFQYISNSPVWSQKITRLSLTQQMIVGCMSFLRELAKQGLPYPQHS